MKKLAIITMAFLALPLCMKAEDKFGYINAQEVLEQLPEVSGIETKMADLQKQYKTEADAMQKELETKFKDYQDNGSTWTDAIKTNKEQELQQLQDRMQTFSQTAQQDLQKQYGDLMQPLIDKVTKAIEEVGKENNFTYIFDSGTQVILYKSSSATDVAPLVRKKLGIKEGAAAAPGK